MDEYGSQVELAARSVRKQLASQLGEFVAKLAPDAVADWLTEHIESIRGQRGLDGPPGPRGVAGPEAPGVTALKLDEQNHLLARFSGGTEVDVSQRSLRGCRGREGKRGSVGPKGFTGPRGDIGPAGPAAPEFHWREGWKSSAQYEPGDIVDLAQPKKDAFLYYTLERVKGTRPPAGPWRRFLPRREVLQQITRVASGGGGGGGGTANTYGSVFAVKFNQNIPISTWTDVVWFSFESLGDAMSWNDATELLVEEAGHYSVQMLHGWTMNGTGSRLARLLINGSVDARNEQGHSAANIADTFLYRYDRHFAAGDTLTTQVWQNGASPLSMRSTQSEFRIQQLQKATEWDA